MDNQLLNEYTLSYSGKNRGPILSVGLGCSRAKVFYLPPVYRCYIVNKLLLPHNLYSGATKAFSLSLFNWGSFSFRPDKYNNTIISSG